jgi:S-adenosylmethionine:tRNA ribosyltransferase-isomerase
MAHRAPMRLSDFDFELPEDRIALRPADPRDTARLLVIPPAGPLQDRVVRELPDLLREGDALVVNDTKVIPARLDGVRDRDGLIVELEATLHRRLSPSRWTAFVKPGRRLKPGDRIRFGESADRACFLGVLDATVAEKDEGGEVTLAFDLSGPDLDAAIAERGRMPLPPYIASKRPEDERDLRDYQTMFAQPEGSVAAPTAGLHFTPGLLDRLQAAGVGVHRVTLHVGAGTFLPVKTEEVALHRMHPEYGEVSAETADALNAVRARGGRVACVGTTSLRLLESATDERGRIGPFASETSIFITPGYRFRAADLLLTNFHLPKSTLFMLVSAFAGLERMRAAYAHAIAGGYRFYSYGDACLLERAA